MAGYRVSYGDACVQVPDRRFMGLGLAVLTSLAIHGAALLMMPGEDARGVANFGHGGVTVSLGPAGRDAGGEVAAEHENFEAAEEAVVAEAEVIETSDTLETVSAETVSAETVSALPEPEVPSATEVADANEVEAVEFETSKTEPIEVEVVEVVEAEIATLETPSIKPTEIVLAAKVAPPPLPRRRPQQVKKPSVHEPPKAQNAANSLKPTPQETTKSETEMALEQLKQVPPKTTDGDTSTLAANQVAGQGGRSGEAGLSEVGQGDNTAGGGMPGADSDYYREVLAWLEKHKRYPRRSKLRNEQGVVLLRFVVSRDGMVTVSAIKKSSGHKRLDKEAIGMIERAQPLPAMPDDMRQAKLDLVVPVKFHLQ